MKLRRDLSNFIAGREALIQREAEIRRRERDSFVATKEEEILHTSLRALESKIFLVKQSKLPINLEVQILSNVKLLQNSHLIINYNNNRDLYTYVNINNIDDLILHILYRDTPYIGITPFKVIENKKVIKTDNPHGCPCHICKFKMVEVKHDRNIKAYKKELRKWSAILKKITIKDEVKKLKSIDISPKERKTNSRIDRVLRHDNDEIFNLDIFKDQAGILCKHKVLLSKEQSIKKNSSRSPFNNVIPQRKSAIYEVVLSDTDDKEDKLIKRVKEHINTANNRLKLAEREYKTIREHRIKRMKNSNLLI